MFTVIVRFSIVTLGKTMAPEVLAKTLSWSVGTIVLVSKVITGLSACIFRLGVEFYFKF